MEGDTHHLKWQVDTDEPLEQKELKCCELMSVPLTRYADNKHDTVSTTVAQLLKLEHNLSKRR